ncbi:colibactin biosynthesis aminomalonyl-acyl carrier protein ClbE [Serratia ureilytica]|uniref:colibactin biosynthesis aminomalonyl-acyl carrier protein ClbE n=1 Tax=Serratia ureilytica TaxID=300181 RepID=UPI0019D1DBD3|nr:colibactin biosynthesis aminomalonyl-acyl carrier protein ClbE [Serratia ureilytica]MBN5215179.1 colibactin biosynthesis aminomalonyl-acyl carrier protein ClbE [Serratia ureilytica]
METQEMKTAIRQFLSRSLRGYTLNDDDDIFSLGLAHSLFTVQIILFIEKTFQIELEVSELKIEQIATVNKMVELIQRQACPE